MRINGSLSVSAIAIALVSCGHAPPGHPSPRPLAVTLPPLSPDRAADDAGRFLAGLPGRPGTPFRSLEAHPVWKAHASALDQAWDRLESANLGAMRRFGRLQTSALGRGVVFYPFSGPDALTVASLFPRSPVYVLVGLEPCGTLPALARIRARSLDTTLEGTRETLQSVLHRSFFITRQMDRQFRGQVSDGLFPAILELLVRSGHRVIGYRYVRLGQNGGVFPRPGNAHAPGTSGNFGLEIDYLSEQDGTPHKLLYFSINLSDGRLRANQSFKAFFAGLGGVTTFFKSTSYMPHRDNFSVIRELVLSQSSSVLQDDSGVPYHYFDPGSWKVQLFGDYHKPYGSFRWLQQSDLERAYASQKPIPIRFRIGYGFSRIPSNLLLATKKSR